MSRWLIEKSGTGIEKSGTGIEKSGTGIEKSGTGIEKSGTGIKNVLFTICFTAVVFSSQVSASNNVDPTGTLSIVVDNEKLAVSWIIGGSVFSGVSSLSGSHANLLLTELSIRDRESSDLKVVGGGTGTNVNVVGGGTGVNVVGGGTGVTVVGGGTGVTVVGGGTGADVVGGGTGVTVVGGGTGSDAILITLPGGTDMQMEVSLGCNSANVSILDSNFVEVVSFNNVPVIGASAYCSGFDGTIGYDLGEGYDLNKKPRGDFYDEK